MLYYENFLSSGVEDNHAQPPPQRYNIILIYSKLFSKIFFKIVKPFVCMGRLTTPYQDPPYNLRGWGTPPTLELSLTIN
jgi:hypothetical protein